MFDWLKRLCEDFMAWLQRNAEAHAKSKPGTCCSNLTPDDVAHITAYIRAQQRRVGIQ